MFYQYLYGRQYELLALRATAGVMAARQNVVPVIEPVRQATRDLEVAAEQLASAGVSVVIITNPRDGDLAGTPNVLALPPFPALLTRYPTITPALHVTPATTPAEVTAFLQRATDRPACLVHTESVQHPAAVARAAARHPHPVTHLFLSGATSRGYRHAFPPASRILLQDSFRRQQRNADYPTEDFFSDVHQTYAQDGYAGFGDFSIVGAEYMDGGGPAHAVAIHLTYDREDGEIWVRHFVSHRRDLPADPGGKFLEAVGDLAKWVRSHPTIAGTAACQEFLAHHANGTFPGLAKVKELSMRHHIELMARIV